MTASILSNRFAQRPSAPVTNPLQAMPGPCSRIGLVAGTRVATPMGYVAVERLGAGDRVLTADGGIASLVRVEITEVAALGAQAPVCIGTGVMDNMRPVRLAQHHRIRVAGWRADVQFDAETVLATAASFVNGTDIVIETSEAPVRYVHLMLDRHAVILAENIACEAWPDSLADQGLPEAWHGAALPILSPAEDRVLQAA